MVAQVTNKTEQHRVPRFGLSQLQSAATLRELHHFLWQDPHVNRGVLDQGWNCRDHAWVTAILAKAAGQQPYVFHGRASFVAKRTASAAGLVVQQATHSWVGVEDVGAIDLSIKPQVLVDGELMKLPITHLFANRLLPAGKAGFGQVRDDATYLRQIDGAQTANKSVAIYLLSEGESLAPQMLAQSAAWINSPLTDRLKSRYPDASAVYCSFALHMMDFITGRTRTLTDVSTDAAWDRVATAAESALSRVQALLALH